MRIDLEETFKILQSFLMEELELKTGKMVSRFNFEIDKINKEKKGQDQDTFDLEFITNSEDRFSFSQRQRENKTIDKWVDITNDTNTDQQSLYEVSAQTFTFTISFLLRDNLSSLAFYKSLRYNEVIRRCILQLKSERQNDFLEVILKNTFQENVSLNGTKLIRSGCVFTISVSP